MIHHNRFCRKPDKQGLSVLALNVVLKEIGASVKKGTKTTDGVTSTIIRFQPLGERPSVFDFGSNKENAVRS